MMAEAFGITVAENVVGTVAGNRLDQILKRISNPIILVFKWKANVENLKQQVDLLKQEEQSVEHYKQAVERRGEEVEQKLTTWQTRTSKSIEGTNTIEDDEEKAKKKCFFGMCLNPLPRYKLSKKAVEDSKDIADLVQEARGFNLSLSYLPIPQPTVAAPVKGFQEFDSRIGVLDKIMEALQSPSINVIGVHGMPGVGKTELLKEVKRKAEQQFDAVVMASVTENPVLTEIQDEIAYGLGLELPTGIRQRNVADRLRARFLKKRKVLVILDDIWDKLDLEAVGIPFEDQQKMNVETGSSSAEDQRTKCKILLSSRELNVLSTKMGTQKEVAVGQLEDKEAWQMFKKIVGDRAESHELQPTGIEIVKKCGGLPVAIAALAEALKNKNLYEWKSALQKLRNPSPSNFTGIYAEVYTAIEVSYNHLESEELKKTFLLSSLMGHNALIQDLLKYGVGLGLFSQANTIEGARVEVLTLISDLKAASLLIDGSDNEHFDMHDVIHDVAMSIASRDRQALLLTDEKVPKEWSDSEAMNDFKWICLRYASVNELPLESSQLTFFCWFNEDLSLEIPANFFKGMQRLEALDLTHMHMSSLPKSICLLKNLHTLCLDQSMLGDIAIVGELKNLQILSLGSSDIEELPREIGQLIRLKLLDLSDCTKLKLIPPHVLASLTILEELYLRNSFSCWEHKVHENQQNASLDELKYMKKLTVLEVCIGDVEMIPKGLFSEKLRRYKIFIGDAWNNWDSSFEISRILKLQLKASINLDYSLKRLLKTTEELHLDELNAVKDLVDELDGEDFKYLKNLYVCNGLEVQQIINSREVIVLNAFPSLEVLFLHNLIKLEKIFQGWFKETSFNKLRVITVECCDQLKNLFSSSVTSQFLQLQEITVAHCSNMEEIVGDEEQGSGNDVVNATEGVQPKFGEQLRSLRLQHLAKLIRFDSSCKRLTLFNDQVMFPNLDELHLSWINVNTIWHTSITFSCVEKLKKLIIEGCHNLEYLFSSSMVRCLVKVEHIELRECKSMRKVICIEDVEGNENLIFPLLTFLLIKDLQNLVEFYSGNCLVEFPSLKELVILNCPEFNGFTVKSTRTDDRTDIQPLFNEQVAFPSLESMNISHLKNLRMMWSNQLSADSFCKLKSLVVGYCENLSTIFPSNDIVGSFWTSLEKLAIFYCGSLEVVFTLGEFNTNRRLDVIDTQLRELLIASLPKLRHVWNKDLQGILTFHNLELVNVSACESLNNLFPASVAKDLRRLQTLRISFSGLEEIVAMGGGTERVVRFEFPLVSCLVLDHLPRLKYFYSGKHTTEWPMLKKFYFSKCGEVKKTDGQEQLDFPVQQPLFSMKEVIPQLEKVSLTKDDIAIMCGEAQFHQYFFPNIKTLQIQDYHDNSAVLPIHFLCRFCNLKKLILTGCGFTGLFPSERDQVEEQLKHNEMLPNIRKLKLDSLQNLRHILSEDSSSVLQDLQTLEVAGCHNLTCLSTSTTTTFRNLTALIVSDCHISLITLVSVSTAQSLEQLVQMTIGLCDNMIEIVGREADGTEDLIINFRKLRFLKLERLKRLESFCSGNFTFEFPSLEKLVVDQCPKLKIFCKGDLKTPLLWRVELNEEEDKWHWAVDLNTTIQKMHTEKVGYAGLKDLVLSDFPELMEIWHDVTRNAREILNFRQLECLELYDCSNFKYLLTPSMVFCLVQLQSITVTKCGMMEQVILAEGEESKMMFPQLSMISLESCSNMTTFYVGKHTLEIPALKSIFVDDCPKMFTFIASTSLREDEKKVSQYFFGSKVEIPNLEHLSLFSINTQQIWHGQLTSISSFVQNLRMLTVIYCGNLKYLITSSMVKNFVVLEKLMIQNCEMMEVVILIEGAAEEERMSQMVFPKLEKLVLGALPQFIRFCSNFDFFPQTYTTKWPSLKSIHVYQCDEVQIFASEFPSIEITHEANHLERQTQHPMFWISKATFPSLEELKLQWNDNMREIWHGQHPEEYFSKLKVVELERSASVPSFFFQSLPNLEKLVVKDTFFNEIFQCEEVGAEEKPVCGHTPLFELRLSKLHELTNLWKEESQLESTFNNLRTLVVQECSKLRNLVPSTVSLQNLQTLKVSRCHGIINLLRDSTAKSLVQLTSMEVINCEMIEEIVVCLGDEGKDGIVFTKLKYLQLKGLPRIASFCSRNCSFQFPSLEDVIVRRCPKMQTFCVGELSTPLLQKLKLKKDEDEGQREGDLNSNIQQLFIEKTAHSYEEGSAIGSEESSTEDSEEDDDYSEEGCVYGFEKEGGDGSEEANDNGSEKGSDEYCSEED